MVEKIVKHRKLNYPLRAQQRLEFYSFIGIVSCIITGTIVLVVTKMAKIKEFLSGLAHKKCWEIPVKNIITELPFVIISFIFVLYLVKNIFLATRIVGFDNIVLLTTILLHCGLTFLVYKKRNINLLPSYLVSCYGVLVISLLLSTMIFDYSWDGQAYHQVAAQQLRNGWNPFYSNLPEVSVFIWNNHYPKFTELFGSIFLSVFNNIEAGKAYNIIFLVITFCYALRYTARYHKNKLSVLVLSILFVMNPVVMAQVFTYYVDGFLGMAIIILFFACIHYEVGHDIKDMIIIIAVSIFAINTKFTGFICGIVLTGYIIRQLVLKNYKQMSALIISGIIILAIGVLFTGYNPYITNFRDFGHPFYPLYGNNKIDIIHGNMPENLVSIHPIKRFFSLFLLNFEANSIPFNPLKILYMAFHGGYDLRIAGFGAFLAEIFVFTCLIIFFSVRKNRKRYKAVFFPAVLLLGVSIIMPENWWARYIPFFWYLFGFFIIASDYSEKKNKILFFLLLTIIIINNGSFFVLNAKVGVLYTENLKRFLAEIKENDNDTIHVVLDYEYFKYALSEKMMFYNIEKSIIIIENSEAPFTNGVVMGYIRGWY
jgi:hypothetical protein